MLNILSQLEAAMHTTTLFRSLIVTDILIVASQILLHAMPRADINFLFKVGVIEISLCISKHNIKYRIVVYTFAV